VLFRSLDIRTTPHLQKHGGAAPLLRDFVTRIDDTAVVEIVTEALPLDTDPQHPMVNKLVSCGAELTGAPWFCEAAFLAAAGTPSIASGPGSIAQAHTKDEYISLDDLKSGVAFFRNFLQSLRTLQTA
jgi:acetylornithine deacetylase/succinyl-diaminopimelate desuccinylase-like protein